MMNTYTKKSRTVMRGPVALLILLWMGPLYAGEKFTRIGMGVSLGPKTVLQTVSLGDEGELGIVLGSRLQSGLNLSVNLPYLKIEPEFTWDRYSMQTSRGAGEKDIVTVLQGGIGVFGRSSRQVSSGVYYGGRAEFGREARVREFDGLERKDTIIHFFVGPAIGAEYFLGRQFSLGVEGQFLFGYYFDYPGGYGENSFTADFSVLESRGLLFFRLYL
jgi:hypothetical protein